MRQELAVKDVLLYLLGRGCVNGAAELVFSEVAELMGVEFAEKDINRFEFGANCASDADRAWHSKMQSVRSQKTRQK